MADDSVLVNKENGRADLGDKDATAVSPLNRVTLVTIRGETPIPQSGQ